jgi:hypothetical protein
MARLDLRRFTLQRLMALYAWITSLFNCLKHIAALAQSVERRSRKAKVMSSILMGGSLIMKACVVLG